jgi:translation initiation factor 2 subunit 1
MTTSTPEKTDGLKALETAIEKIEEAIKKFGGVFQIKMAVSQF